MSGGAKSIATYGGALAKVFAGLTEDELKQCEDLVEANKRGPYPEDLQRK